MDEHNEEERRATAYHEAGHAVMRLSLGRSVMRASIRPGGDTLGHVRHRRPNIDREWLELDWAARRLAETAIMVALAGPEAEERLTGRRNDVGAAGDDEHVMTVARDAGGDTDEERQAYLTWLQLRVKGAVSHSLFWRQVEAVAAALLERETLTGAEIGQIRRQALGFKELSISPPEVTSHSRNVGYAWSTKVPPERPDMMGTLTAVRGALGRVHLELEPPFFERLFIGGVPIDDRGGELSAPEILSMLEDQARQGAEWARQR